MMETVQPEDTQMVPLSRLLQAVVDKTIAVRRGSAEQRAEWLQTLGELEGVVDDQGIWEMATFLDVLREYLAGGDPQRLEILVAPDFKPAWQTILDGTPDTALGEQT